MTRLLVSVRSLDEARLAVSAGVDLIDLKEPRHGSLGRVNAPLAWQVADAVPGDIPLSMALGELTEWGNGIQTRDAPLPPRIRFAKIGLAGCATKSGWHEAWRRTRDSLPAACSLVAVVYADWRPAEAPRPAAILRAAVDHGCGALLIDTFQKTSGDVFAHCATEELARLLGDARAAGMLTVLAGSLRLETLPAALTLRPDYVAVRGAVCAAARESALAPTKLAQWVRRLSAAYEP